MEVSQYIKHFMKEIKRDIIFLDAVNSTSDYDGNIWKIVDAVFINMQRAQQYIGYVS